MAEKEPIGASITMQIPMDKFKKLEIMSEYEGIPISQILASLLMNGVDIMYDQLTKEGVV